MNACSFNFQASLSEERVGNSSATTLSEHTDNTPSMYQQYNHSQGYEYRSSEQYNNSFSELSRQVSPVEESSPHGMIFHSTLPFYSSTNLLNSWNGHNGIDYRMHNMAISFQKLSKQKRGRMSTQKRMLVNARERERMRVLNKAFESLRDALPCYIADGHMAKITTLRLAINYINALNQVLTENKSTETNVLDSIENSLEKTQETIIKNVLKT
ncbi:twist-related protein [Hydra vulgaris]|uniref:Twist-related protein n=1 Tax=Hydra vulgaris TaxID=6087 RepID=A0ABM4BZK9_HYDVU